MFAGLDLDCLAGGWIAALRAARLRTCRMPSPVIFTLSPFFKCLVIMTIRSSSIFWLARLLRRCCSASAVTKSFLLMLTSASAVAAAVVQMG